MQPSLSSHCSHTWRLTRQLLGVIVLLGLTAPLLSLAATSNGTTPSAAYETLVEGTPIVLYDGSLNTGTPDKQHMVFLTRPFTSPVARQSFADGVTTLTTTLKTSEIAGYSGNSLRVPALSRTAGFSLRFTVQLLAENHARSDKNGDGIGDRAGLDVTLLSSDRKGIELGFWQNQVWAQEDGLAEPPPNTNTLFTHAESAAFNPTSGLITYELIIQEDTYTLTSGGTVILSGRVRDYTAGGFPYTSANFVFLGDNSGSASGRIKLAAVSIVANSVATATPTSSTTPTSATTLEATTTPIAATPTSPIQVFTPEAVRVLVPVVQRN